MSLPSPTTTKGGYAPRSTNIFSEQEQKEWDAPLAALAQKSGGDLRQLMYAFFSFLHRRTDFYMIRSSSETATSQNSSTANMGFREGEAEQLLLAAFRQFPLVKIPAPKTAASQVVPTPAKPEIKLADHYAEPTALQGAASSDISTSMAAPTITDIKCSKSSSYPTNERSQTTKKKAEDDRDGIHSLMAHVRLTEEGKQIPVGNGGCTKSYQWTQTIDEASVVAKLPEGTKAKDLQVTIRPTFLSVQLKQSTNTTADVGSGSDDITSSPATCNIILEGDLVERIRPEESTWTIESSALLVTLEKVSKTWWPTVFLGDDEIDTQLVDSTRKIAEYDESTQGALRKIMFDQSQYRLGLPSSDQILGKPSVALPPGVEYIDSETLKKYAQENPNQETL